MRTAVIFALLLVVAFGAMTNKKFTECSTKKLSECDTACLTEYNNKCGPGSSVYTSTECKYLQTNAITDANKDWSSDYAKNFHSCQDKCVSATSGNSKKWAETLKKCDAATLLFSALAASAAVFALL